MIRVHGTCTARAARAGPRPVYHTVRAPRLVREVHGCQTGDVDEAGVGAHLEQNPRELLVLLEGGEV